MLRVTAAVLYMGNIEFSRAPTGFKAADGMPLTVTPVHYLLHYPYWLQAKTDGMECCLVVVELSCRY